MPMQPRKREDSMYPLLSFIWRIFHTDLMQSEKKKKIIFSDVCRIRQGITDITNEEEKISLGFGKYVNLFSVSRKIGPHSSRWNLK